MGVGGQCHTQAALPPEKRPGTPCTGGWVGLRAGLDRCGKSCLCWGLNHRPFSHIVSASTELSQLLPLGSTKNNGLYIAGFDVLTAVLLMCKVL
jgi:hypothetical protein